MRNWSGLRLNRCRTGWVSGESGAESVRVDFEDGKWPQTGPKPVRFEAEVVRNRMRLVGNRSDPVGVDCEGWKCR